MAALTLPEALKRTGSPLMAGIAKSVATTDMLGAKMPMTLVSSVFAESMREGAEPAAPFIDDDGTTNDSTVGTDDRIAVPLRRIVGNMDIDGLADDLTAGGPGGQTAAQLPRKIKAAWRNVTNKIVNGGNVTGYTFGAPSTAAPAAAISAISVGPWIDSTRKGPGAIRYTNAGTLWAFRAPGDVQFGPDVAIAANGTATLRSWNPSYFITITVVVASATVDGESSITFQSSTKEFDGMIKVCDPSQLIDPVGVDGDPFAFALMDQLMSNEKIRTNRAFIMSASMANMVRAAYRALGGARIETVALDGYGAGEMGGAPVLAYSGIPILEDDFIGSETVGATTTCQSIYIASLDEMEGLSLGVANVNAQAFDPMASPDRAPVLGWRIKHVGELEAKDHYRTRVTWYGALLLRSKLALVRKRGVKLSLT